MSKSFHSVCEGCTFPAFQASNMFSDGQVWPDVANRQGLPRHMNYHIGPTAVSEYNASVALDATCNIVRRSCLIDCPPAVASATLLVVRPSLRPMRAMAPNSENPSTLQLPHHRKTPIEAGPGFPRLAPSKATRRPYCHYYHYCLYQHY